MDCFPTDTTDPTTLVGWPNGDYTMTWLIAELTAYRDTAVIRKPTYKKKRVPTAAICVRKKGFQNFAKKTGST